MQGIKNHDVYYSHQFENSDESIAANCGRLADTLSFMPSDLSDIMRADKSDGSEKIVPVEAVERLKESLKKTECFEKLDIDGVVDKLINERLKGVKYIQEKIIEEVADNNKLGRQIISITDEHKYLDELCYKFNENEKMFKESGTLSDENMYAYTLLDFDKYAKTHIKGYRPLDDKVKALIEFKLSLENKTPFSEALRQYGQKIGKNISSSISEEEIKKCYHELMKKFFQINDFHKRLSDCRNALRQSCPVLATVFEMQNQLQYNEIIMKGKTHVFGNDEEKFGKIINWLMEKNKNDYEKMSDLEKEKLSFPEFTSDRKIDYAISQVQKLTNSEIDESINLTSPGSGAGGDVEHDENETNQTDDQINEDTEAEESKQKTMKQYMDEIQKKKEKADVGSSIIKSVKIKKCINDLTK